MGRDLLVKPIGNEACVFQSTRPRGARLFVLVKDATGQGVSIHAPAWGATGVVLGLGQPVPVSIHAPAWGATAWRRTP